MKNLTKAFAIATVVAATSASAFMHDNNRGWGGNNMGPFSGGNTMGPFSGGNNMGPFSGGNNMGPFSGGQNWGPMGGRW